MNEEEFLNQHREGLKGILNLYTINIFERSLPLKSALLLSFLFIILFGCFDISIKKAILIILPLGITIFPTIFGFSLAGYILLIGFSGSENFRHFTVKATGQNGSLYQISTAIFSIHLFVNIIAVFVYFVTSLTISSGLGHRLFNSFVSTDNYEGMQMLLLFILMAIAFYSIFTVLVLIINIFNFSQASHSVAYVDRIEKDATGKINEPN